MSARGTISSSGQVGARSSAVGQRPTCQRAVTRLPRRWLLTAAAATAAAAGTCRAFLATGGFGARRAPTGQLLRPRLGQSGVAVARSLRGVDRGAGTAATDGLAAWDVDFEFGSGDEAEAFGDYGDFADLALWSLPVQETSAKAAVDTVKRWLAFLKTRSCAGAGALADAAGYPLEHALELFAEELHRGASIVTMQLPDGAPRVLGPIGLVASIRAGEDLDLSLFGGKEWETIHLDFMATNPSINWPSELISSSALRERLCEAGGCGLQLLQQLLDSAAKAGRAVTVAPLNDELKETYRSLGFLEDSLLDPTLMFWIPPSDEVLPGLGSEPQFAYGSQ